MYFKTTSHVSRERVEYVLGRKPQYYYTMADGGVFIKIDDPTEIEKVKAAKGVKLCRDQKDATYKKCWKM